MDAPLAAVAATERYHEGFRVEEFGGASADKALSKAFEDDFKKAEVTSLPITLIILILAFGALLAAFVPAAPGRDRRGGRHRAASARSARSGRWTSRSRRVVLLIGLAVGVDYSMFYLRREREERAAGRARRPRSRPRPPPRAARS